MTDKHGREVNMGDVVYFSIGAISTYGEIAAIGSPVGGHHWCKIDAGMGQHVTTTSNQIELPPPCPLGYKFKECIKCMFGDHKYDTEEVNRDSQQV